MMSSDIDALYITFLNDLKQRIQSARLHAAITVNRELIILYWTIGKEILSRQASQSWGAHVIDRLAEDLRHAFPDMTGLSARNLKYMRSFAQAYPNREIVQQVVAQLPWSHNIRLIESLKDEEERLWYAHQAIEYGWSRSMLVHQIESDLFSRQGRATTNFKRTLPPAQSDLARQIVKDPYNFDFLAVGPDISERELERGLLEQIRAFILELGKGFAFVGSQYRLNVGGQDYYLDLLFYHLRLRCFVVIDLKIEEFKPEFAGKMNFYLSAVDDQLRHAADAPSIGLILCKNKNEVVVEYSLRDSAKPMGVAEYKVSAALSAQLERELPTVEEIVREFPSLSVLQLRIEIERELRTWLESLGSEISHGGITPMLRELQQYRVLPASTKDFEKALYTMNAAAHGKDVDEAAMGKALAIGGRFLDQIRAQQVSPLKGERTSG